MAILVRIPLINKYCKFNNVLILLIFYRYKLYLENIFFIKF